MNYGINSKLKTQNSKLLPGLHIGVASLGIFLAALDQTVIVTALWAISTDLRIPITELDRAAWVITAYLLGYTVALPLMGRVADVYGQRRVYLLSLGIFMGGSLACALASNLEWLVAARFVQAVGGGAMLPVGMAMAQHLFAERRVPFVLGVLGAVAEAGAVIGPLWGALLMRYADGLLGIAGWRWIFWVNLPLGVLFALLMLRTPRLPRFPGKIDWVGAALFGASLLSLSLGLASPGTLGALAGINVLEAGGEARWLTPQSVGLVALSLVLFAVFALWQRRAPEPLVPPDLFTKANWPFTAANLTNLLVGAALIITMVNVPLYVASVLGGTAEQGGLMLLRMTIFIPVGAVLGGLLIAEWGMRNADSGPRSIPHSPFPIPHSRYGWVAVAGLLVAAVGFWQMSGWTVTSGDEPVTWVGLALNGLGFGLLISPVTATALQWGGLRQAALSAASVNLARMVGMMVSLSVLTVWGLRHFQALMAAHPAPLFPNPGETAEAFAQRQAGYALAYKEASLEVYSAGFTAAAVVCLAATLLAIWLRRDRLK